MIILSLTTLPIRWNRIKPCLDSLLNQEHDDFEIHLNLPLKSESFNGFEFGSIKDIHPKIKVFYVDDLGPITKIYYTLQRYKGTNQTIISVDDDVVYHSKMIQEYEKWITIHSNDTLGFKGIDLVDGSFESVRDVDTPTETDILEGYKSVCYNANHFEDDFFNEFYKRNVFDDPTLSGYLKIKGINRLVIPHDYDKSNHWFNSFPTIGQIHNQSSGCNDLKKIAGEYKENYTKFFNNIN